MKYKQKTLWGTSGKCKNCGEFCLNNAVDTYYEDEEGNITEIETHYPICGKCGSEIK